MTYRSLHFSLLLTVVVGLALSGCSTPPPPPLAAPTQIPQPLLPATSQEGMPTIWPADAPPIYAQSAILINARNGRVLYQKNADTERPVASTQKLLTALIVAENGNLDDLVTIQNSETHVEPIKLGMRAGEKYPRRTLLQVMMVKSANDVAAALARDYSGSESAFVTTMNDTARRLGATSSYFLNPHGLPSPQHSTARDMARIAFRAYRNVDLRKMMLVQEMYFRFNNGKVTRLKATNDLLKKSPAFTGMKTGYTVSSGRCLITSANLNGKEFILVQLGSKTKYIFDDAERLILWAANQ